MPVLYRVVPSRGRVFVGTDAVLHWIDSGTGTEPVTTPVPGHTEPGAAPVPIPVPYRVYRAQCQHRAGTVPRHTEPEHPPPRLYRTGPGPCLCRYRRRAVPSPVPARSPDP